jgi:hypothetical protein
VLAQPIDIEEEAQKRKADALKGETGQAKRVVQRALTGLAVSLVLAVGAAAWTVCLVKAENEANNQARVAEVKTKEAEDQAALVSEGNNPSVYPQPNDGRNLPAPCKLFCALVSAGF